MASAKELGCSSRLSEADISSARVTIGKSWSDVVRARPLLLPRVTSREDVVVFSVALSLDNRFVERFSAAIFTGRGMMSWVEGEHCTAL